MSIWHVTLLEYQSQFTNITFAETVEADTHNVFATFLHSILHDRNSKWHSISNANLLRDNATAATLLGTLSTKNNLDLVMQGRNYYLTPLMVTMVDKCKTWSQPTDSYNPITQVIIYAITNSYYTCSSHSATLCILPATYID